MRIFHLCAGAKVGGAETAFVQTCIAMHQAGWDVTAICRPHPEMTGPLGEADVPTYTLPFGGFFDFTTKRALRELIREQRPDIVQTWMNRAAKHCPRPSPSLPPFKLVARLGGYYKLKHYEGVDHFITNTADIKTYLTDNHVPTDHVTVINNLVMLDEDDTPVSRANMNTPEDAFVFLTLSRLHEAKGIDDFIDALTALPENAYGWIAGEGPDRAALEQRAKSKNVAHRVKFLGWRSDRTALLKAANTLVLPSRFEPFGNTFAQGWAAGTPLITTNTAGPSLFVRHDDDALLVPISEPASLSAAMRRVMTEAELGERLAAAGQRRYQEEFTVEGCLTAYDALYKQLRQNH